MGNGPRTRIRCRRLTTGIAIVFVAAASLSAPARGQSAATKKVFGAEDYTRWRNISGQAISGDGKWVIYELQFLNRADDQAKPELHLLNLGNQEDVVVSNATRGGFSSDSRWLAYQVNAGSGGRGNDTTSASPPRVELRDLSTGATQSWQNGESFVFSNDASHVIVRQRPASGGGAPAPATGGTPAPGARPTGPRGTDVILHNLASNHDQVLARIADIAFNKTSELLAYTVDATDKTANGLFVLNLRTGRTTILDNDAKRYSQLAWSPDGSAIAALKGTDVEKMRELANVLLVFSSAGGTGVDAPDRTRAVLDPATAEFPEGWVVSDRAALSWSSDQERVFFGVKPQLPAPPAGRSATREDVADVDVWHSRDERPQSVQMLQADADRNFTYRASFDIPASRFVRLADETMKELEVAPDGRWAVGRDTRSYVSDYKPAAADLYRVSATTGERTLIVKGQLIGSHAFGISPSGRYFLYWKANSFVAYDLETGTSRMLGGNAKNAPSFVNREWNYATPRPSYGIAGFSSDGKSVIVHQRDDLWLLPLDGSTPRNLTDGIGAKNEIQFRVARSDPFENPLSAIRTPIDLSKPITLSAFGELTKKSGFYRLDPSGRLNEVVYEDAEFGNLQRAANADVFLFTRQTFVEFPDLRVSGPDFKHSTRISDANPQQREYVWGRRILFDYKNKDGVPLQGILALPDDYKPGEKRPMLVGFYESMSWNLNLYPLPRYFSNMLELSIQAVSQGYITMYPDVHFRVGAGHSSMLECVEAAVRKVIELGYVDPKRIGLHGHSYSGDGAEFIATRSKLFAAVAAGAGEPDLMYAFNLNWGWSYQNSVGPGMPESGYYLSSQGRMQVAPWDDVQLYLSESPLAHARGVTAPILLLHGTADATIAFHNSLAFYNALRYNGKNAILLAYPGEGHGLRRLANRKDLTLRFFQFFDHYLKDAPAPKWMTDGVPFLQKNAPKDLR
jgi:dipeptidyl aminopeptidase/acylaminoacyl peptidase